MQILDFSVSNQILSASCPGRLVVSQTRGHLFAQVALDHEWDGLSVTAVFSNDFARKSYQRILTADPVEVPEEVLVPGRLFVSLVGLGDGGAVRLTTKRMDKPIVVYRAGDLVGLTPEETTPELWEQVMSVIGSLDELQTSDKSSLVAAINAVLQSGGGGSVDPDAIAQAVADYMAAHPIQETDPTVPAWAKQTQKPTYTAAEVGALPDTYTPPVDAALSETSTNPVQNKVVAAKLSEVESIAKGRATGHVFETETDMRTWIAANASALNLGDNLYIRATDVPDYWWDGTSAQPMETQKVDLTEYAKKSEVPAVDTTLTQSGKAADAAEVGARLSSLSEEIDTTSESKVSAHNTGTNTHNDIRVLIQGLTDRLNALADSDDTTLDQLSEVVAYIKSNRGLIDAITTSKVSVSDIVDNLTTNVANKPLSAAQGVALKALIDAISIPEKLPNPNALTFTGAVTGSYDGSAPLEVEIPSSGGGASGDYIPNPTSAQVGQTIVVKAVDENGKPTEWEAADMASGSGSGGGIHLIARVVTEANAASIEVTGLSTTAEVLSLRIYNPGSTCGGGLCITANGLRKVVYAGTITGANTIIASVRAWLYRDGDTLYGRSQMANEAINVYEWPGMGEITSIAVDSYYNDGTTKYFQTGTIFEIYEGAYPNVS